MSKILTFMLFLSVTSLCAQSIYSLDHESYMRILLEKELEDDLVVKYEIDNDQQLVSQIDNFPLPLIVLLYGPERFNQNSKELLFANQYEQCVFEPKKLDQSKQILIGRLRCKGCIDSQVALDKLKNKVKNKC